MALLTGVQEIDQEVLVQLLRRNIRTGGSFMTFGPAGIGKTEMAMQACASEEYDYIYLNLSVLEAPDLNGLPMIDEKGDVPVSRYAPPAQFPLAGSGKKKKVLLVDEADKAKPELQNPMLELVQFRSVNGTKLDIHSVLMTGNLPDENSFSQPMSHALMNRCSVYRVTHAFDPWQEWAVDSQINPLVVGFLSQNTEMLLQPPPDGDDTAYCHPSPRSWTLAAKDLDSGDGNESTDLQTVLVAGRVGQPAAVKFRVWLDHYRHVAPLIKALVEKGEKPNVNQESLDRIIVCAIAGVEAIMRECRKNEGSGKNKDDLKKVHQVSANVMNWLKDLPGDICIAAVKSTLTMKVIQDNQLTKVKPFMDTYLKIRKAMEKGS